MEPPVGNDEFSNLTLLMGRLDDCDHSVTPLLWALAQEDDEYPAARARVAAWVGRPAAEVGELLGEALAKIKPGLSADAACAAVRPLLRTALRKPTAKQRGQLLHTQFSAEYRAALAAAANGSRSLAKDHYYTIATLYPALRNPKERLRALRHALATGEIDLGLEPVPPPRFDDVHATRGSVQERYRELGRTDQDRIVRFDKDHRRRVPSEATPTLEHRTRQVLERLFPDERTDVELARALQLAIGGRQLDLDRR